MNQFIDKIIFQQQPTPVTCVSTCIAMLLNVDVQEVISEFHQNYFEVKENKAKVSDYLKSKGVDFNICNFEDSPEKEGMYFVTVPSLNIKAGNHQIIWILEAAEQEGYFYQRVLDPATGREDRFYYTNHEDLLNYDPLATKVYGYSLDFHISKEYLMGAFK